jgi:hypothetical protein
MVAIEGCTASQTSPAAPATWINVNPATVDQQMGSVAEG